LSKGKPKVKPSPRELLTIIGLLHKKRILLNYLITFFVNIGPTLAEEIKTDHTDPLQYIESMPSNGFYLAPVTQTQVFTLFSGLRENKAFLNVPIKRIKLSSGQLSAPFTEIYNESILSGEFPEIFKISKVTPLFKSGSISELGNYRPIAVIPPFSKVLERLVHDQLVSYLEKECLLHNFQFGFRTGYYTE